jgi:hypothetical protein
LKEIHHAIPHDIVRANVEARKQKKDGQQKLDGIVQNQKATEFTREGVLKAVAEFIVCDDQVGRLDYCVRLSASTSCRAYLW